MREKLLAERRSYFKLKPEVMALVHAEAITENAERAADDLADNSFDVDLDVREVAESKILDW